MKIKYHEDNYENFNKRNTNPLKLGRKVLQNSNYFDFPIVKCPFMCSYITGNAFGIYIIVYLSVDISYQYLID